MLKESFFSTSFLLFIIKINKKIMKQANVRRIKKERIKRIHVKKHEKIIKFLMFSRITSKSKGNEQRIAKKCYKRKKKMEFQIAEITVWSVDAPIQFIPNLD